MKDITQQADLPESPGLKKQKTAPVCTFCKKRKIKCDRQTPCSSCVKFDNKECVYLDSKRTRRTRRPQAVKSSTIESEIDLLKAKIEDLEQSVRHKSFVSHDLSQAEQIELPSELTMMLKPVQEARFNILGEFSTVITMDGCRTGNYGPMSLKCVTELDPSINLIWKFVGSNIHDKMKPATSFKQFRQSTSSSGLKIDRLNSSMDVDCTSQNIHKTQPLMGPTVKSEQADSSSLLSQIEQMLPIKQVIYKYIDWFFSFLYPVYPFLDRIEFETRIKFLIPKVELHDRPRSIRIESALDFAYLGVLLTILRLTCVTLSVSRKGDFEANTFTEETNNEILEIRYLLKNPIVIDTIYAARECLAQFDLYGVMKLPILQLALFVRIYKIHGPEYGDSCGMGSESRIHNSSLFQMAYSYGLNRELRSGSGTTPDPRVDNLARKIWYYLLYLDMSQSLEFGDPLCSSMYSFDTRVPFVTADNSNVSDPKVEKAVIERFQFVGEVYESFKSFFVANVDFQTKTELTKLIKQLTYLENKVFQLDDLSGPYVESRGPKTYANDITELLKFRLQFQFGYFLMAYYHILFNYFEKKGYHDIAYYFLNKGLTKHLVELVPFMCQIAKGTRAYEYHADLIFMPVAALSLHRGLVALFSLYIRSKITLLNYENSPNHLQKMNYDFQYSQQYQVLKQILALSSELSEQLANVIKIFSTRYYYSWVVRKLHTFLSMVVKTNLFEERVYKEYIEFPILKDHAKARGILSTLTLAKTKQSSTPNLLAQLDYGSDFDLSEMLGFGADSGASDASSANTLPTVTEDSDSMNHADNIDSLWFSLFNHKDVKSKTNVYSSDFEDLILRTNLEPYTQNIGEALGMQVPTPTDGGNEFLNAITFDQLFNDLPHQ